MEFQYTPVNGLLDTTIYPTQPTNEAAARQQFMDLFNQARNFINTNILDVVAGGEISTNSNGYITIPLKDAIGPVKKIILQWGTIQTGNANNYANGLYTTPDFVTNLPKPFPNAGLIPFASSGSSSYAFARAYNLTKTQITLSLSSPYSEGTKLAWINWFAIGY